MFYIVKKRRKTIIMDTFLWILLVGFLIPFSVGAGAFLMASVIFDGYKGVLEKEVVLPVSDFELVELKEE